MQQVQVIAVPDKPYQHRLVARQHTLISDVPENLSGGDTGPTPHELALLALGACAAMTMEMKARALKVNVTIEVTITETQIDDPEGGGKKIPHIKEDLRVIGTLTPTQEASLKRAALNCPVFKLFNEKKVIESVLTVTAPEKAAGEAPADAPASASTGDPASNSGAKLDS